MGRLPLRPQGSGYIHGGGRLCVSYIVQVGGGENMSPGIRPIVTDFAHTIQGGSAIMRLVPWRDSYCSQRLLSWSFCTALIGSTRFGLYIPSVV